MSDRSFIAANSAPNSGPVESHVSDRLSPSTLILACAIPVVLVAILVISLISREASVQTSGGKQSDSNPAASTSINPADLQRTATLRYWQDLKSAFPGVPADADNEATAKALRQTADSIANLSSLNVDQDALALGAAYTTNLRDIADKCEYLSSPQFLADCYLQGSQNADIGWGIRKRGELETAGKQEIYEIEEKRTAVRQTLSQRYGIEFSQ
jgi:hypothetical protein